MVAIFQTAFWNAFYWMKYFLIDISLKFVPEVPIGNILALVQVKATSKYLNQWGLAYWRIYASFGLKELTLLHAVTPSLPMPSTNSRHSDKFEVRDIYHCKTWKKFHCVRVSLYVKSVWQEMYVCCISWNNAFVNNKNVVVGQLSPWFLRV